MFWAEHEVGVVLTGGKEVVDRVYATLVKPAADVLDSYPLLSCSLCVSCELFTQVGLSKVLAAVEGFHRQFPNVPHWKPSSLLRLRAQGQAKL